MIKNSLAKYRFNRNLHSDDVLKNEIKFGLLEEFLVEEFTYFLEHLVPFISSDLELTIHFLPSDTFENDWIAMYNAQNSSRNKYDISFNQNVMNWFANAEPLSNKIEIQKAVLHELIHALDHQVISESRLVYLTSKNQTFTSPQLSTNFWIFMHYISNLRNEGVAMYAEHLYFSDDYSASRNYLTFFKKDFQYLISFCESEINEQTSYQRIGEICSRLQKYAGFIMRDVVNSQCALNSTMDKNQLLHTAFNIDVSEWITYLFNVYHSNNVEFQADSIFSFFSRINRSQSTKFSFTDFYALYELEDEHYIRFLTSICPERLPFVALNEKLSALEKQEYIHDIQQTIKNQIVLLLETRDDQNADLIDWTISYFLHKIDAIDDRLDFVGYLDDWMIVDITMQRVNSK